MFEDDTKLILLEIKSTNTLTAKLRETTSGLETAFASTPNVEIAPLPATGLKSLDPQTVHFLLAVGEAAASGLAGALAKDLYTWLRRKVDELRTEDKPQSLTLSAGPGNSTSVPLTGDIDSADTHSKIEAVLQKGAQSRSDD